MLYLLRKVLASLTAVFGIFILMYILSSFLPGDTARMLLGQHANPSTYRVLQQEIGTDQPLVTGLMETLRNFLRGNWGRSHVSHREVREIIGAALPITIKLCFFALGIALVIGISLGAWSAFKENTLVDRVLGAISAAGFSLPHFWLAIMLQVIFGLVWKVLPVSGIGEGQLYFYILPGLAIGIPLGMAYTRLFRSFLLETLDKPFIKAARGWGLSARQVFIHHVTPNVLYLLFVQVATDAAFLLGGAVVSETIFALPGVGSTLVNAILARDWPVAYGIILITAMMVAGLNLLVNITGPLMDPRLQQAWVKGGANK